MELFKYELDEDNTMVFKIGHSALVRVFSASSPIRHVPKSMKAYISVVKLSSGILA